MSPSASWLSGILSVALLSPLQALIYAPIFWIAYRFLTKSKIGYWKSYQICLLRTLTMCLFASIGPLLMHIGWPDSISVTCAIISIFIGVLFFYAKFVPHGLRSGLGFILAAKQLLSEILLVVSVMACFALYGIFQYWVARVVRP